MHNYVDINIIDIIDTFHDIYHVHPYIDSSTLVHHSFPQLRSAPPECSNRVGSSGAVPAPEIERHSPKKKKKKTFTKLQVSW